MLEPPIVARALRLLGKRSLVLSIHDPSFPSAPGDDTGRGSPYTRGGRRFLEFIAALGFTGLQLGPQGQTSASNPSPYDGTLFARNPLSIDLHALAHDPRWAGILDPASFARHLAAAPAGGRRVAHARVHAAQRLALDAVHAGLLARRDDPALALLLARFTRFQRDHAAWLVPHTLHALLCELHRGDDWRTWPGLDARLHRPAADEHPACAARRHHLLTHHAVDLERHALAQFIAHEQHRELHAHTRRLGLELLGDLQIGASLPDLWAHGALFLADYLMGAPPSRTNPDGQPWNYPVLDPSRYHLADGRPGPVLEFMSARVGKLLAEYDGLRIDHPHGLVCPWVYRADAPDPLRAVQAGARLFSSPDLPDHPGLARHAIARPDQLDRAVPRHADGWVRDLDDVQVTAYSALFDTLVAAARQHGRAVDDLLCEVLSTQPYPLRRVLARHGLGRFRVTQKADLTDPADGYRSENAAPADWIMVGNHDTPTAWALVRRWHADGTAHIQARYLAGRLAPADADLDAFARQLADDPRRLALAKFADLFTSPAEHVLIFFADLLGELDSYNVPGTVNDENWSLRIPTDYAREYTDRRRDGTALDLPAALAMALRRRDQPDSPERRDLLAALDAAARAPE